MSEPLRIPLSLVFTDAAGALITGLGVYGLMSETPPAWLPALGDPGKAWLLIGLGGAMMAWAVGRIIAIALRSRRPG